MIYEITLKNGNVCECIADSMEETESKFILSENGKEKAIYMKHKAESCSPKGVSMPVVEPESNVIITEEEDANVTPL